MSLQSKCLAILATTAVDRLYTLVAVMTIIAFMTMIQVPSVFLQRVHFTKTSTNSKTCISIFRNLDIAAARSHEIAQFGEMFPLGFWKLKDTQCKQVALRLEALGLATRTKQGKLQSFVVVVVVVVVFVTFGQTATPSKIAVGKSHPALVKHVQHFTTSSTVLLS